MKQADPFYKSTRWVKLRARILRRDGYMCQISKRYGKQVPANTVHHIFPREEYPEYSFAPWNLISVSQEVHNQLEDRASGRLTAIGLELMKRTAKQMGIPVRRTVLVIGLPGTGKTTYVRRHLGDRGIAYDLDAIAAAFRLRQPHEETSGPAREMANDLMLGFARNALRYADEVFIIRTAPTPEELSAIGPDELVWMREKKVHSELPRDRLDDLRRRIDDAIAEAKRRRVPIREI